MDGNNHKKKRSVNGSEQDLEQVLSSMSTPKGKGKEAAWNEIFNTIQKRKKAGKDKPGRNLSRLVVFHSAYRMPAKIAASFLIFFIAGFSIMYLLSAKTIISTAKGETLSKVLPDKSEVILNAGSTISYKRTGFKKNREVSLEGEAFFSVSSGAGFTVVFESGSVTSLGTSFNVYSRDNIVEVLCQKGAIRVDLEKISISEELGAGEGIRKEAGVTDDLIRKIGFSASEGVNWLKGEFRYDNATLQEVFREMERQFNITIDTDEVDLKRRYSGLFEHLDLQVALDMVCLPMNLRYEILDENKVKIW